jgi:NTP pyrophosphatase (non-canonical NTP hydrolase)
MTYPYIGINPNEYQNQIINLSKNYSIYGTDKALMVYALGLSEECGEVEGLLKRHYRGDFDNESNSELKEKLTKELGDLLAYLSLIAFTFDIELEDIMDKNLSKINKRILDKSHIGTGSDR